MPHATSPPLRQESTSMEPIAICGMACRLPGGIDSASSFWDMLVEGRDGQTPKVPESRFNIDAHYHTNLERPGSFNVMGGYFLDGKPTDFDANAFNMTPIEARWLDPQQRKMLEVVYECLESAGLPKEEVAGSNTAVFVGCFTADYQQMSTKDPDFRHNYVATGVDPGIISNRIGNIFDLRGPSFTINTACSSSVYAVHNACHALRARDCDAAIAGGVNLILTVDQHMNTAKLGILSPTSFCHTFDASADGYGRAEGAGALYLKRLSDAIRDGDSIRAIIRSTAVNTNGKVAGMGITHPSKAGQERVVRQAYQKSGLDPNNTLYAELHGTGTPVGDPIEVEAVSKAMNDTRSKDKPLILGAVKPNIGHSEAASGVFAIMKASLMTEKALVPGVARFQTLNPNIKEDEWNVKINTVASPWPSNDSMRRAGVSSFGYGGTNGHVIVESVESQYPWYSHAAPKKESSEDRGTSYPHLVCFSAHDKLALSRNIEALSKQVDRYYASDLAYTLNMRRSKLQERAFAIGTDGNLSDSLKEDRLQFGSAMKGEPELCFVFTGQGAQWAGMGRAAINLFPSMKDSLARLDGVLSRLSPRPSFSLLDVLARGDGEQNLNQPDYAQPLCTAIQIAIVDLFDEWGITPSVTVGHSSGEVAAAYAAGLMSAPEAIITSYCRGQAVVQTASEGMMLAVGLGASDVEPFLQGQEDVWIACENSPSSVTLSGTQPAIQSLKATLEAQQVFARELKTGRAYHSPQMEPVSVRYKQLLRDARNVLRPGDADWSKPRSAMVSSVTGDKVVADAIPCDSEYWCQNLRQRVLFNSAVERIGRGGTDGDEISGASGWNTSVYVEIGPHAALGGPLRQVALSSKPTYVPSLKRKGDGVHDLLSTAGALWTLNYPVDLTAVNTSTSLVPPVSSKIKSRATQLIVDLPPYQWNYTNEYWAEPRASAEQRALKAARHDLLGSRVAGLTERAAVWRNVLRHRDLPWLVDHSLGDVAVFPAAGHMSLAIEAVRQLTCTDPSHALQSVTIRDCDISTALVVPNTDDGIEVQCHLERVHADREDWYRFTIESLSEDAKWTTHCVGRVAANYSTDDAVQPHPVKTENLNQKTSAQRWYDSFHRVGFQYGPHFQRLRQVSTKNKWHSAAAGVELVNQVFDGESPYLIHPSTVDACLQLIIISIHSGAHKTMPWGVVPLRFDQVIFSAPDAEDLGVDGKAVAWTDGFHGRRFTTHTQLQSQSGKTVLDVMGLTCISYEAALPPKDDQGEKYREPYAETVWMPDLASMSADDVARCWPGSADADFASKFLTHLLHHKKPITSAAFVLNMETPHMDSVVSVLPSSTKLVAGFLSEHAELTKVRSSMAFEDLAPAVQEWPSSLGTELDLLVVDAYAARTLCNDEAVEALDDLVADDGYVMVLPAAPDTSQSELVKRMTGSGLYSEVITLQTDAGSLALYSKAFPSFEATAPPAMTVISAENDGFLVNQLRQAGSPATFNIKSLDAFDATCDQLVAFDATQDSEWADMTKATFDRIKTMLTAGVAVLWVTRGVKEGSSSYGNMAEGFLRVVQSELPSTRVSLLDIDSSEHPESVQSAIAALSTKIDTRESGVETEFWLRGGIIHVSRVMPNKELNSLHFGAQVHELAAIPRGKPYVRVEVDGESAFQPLPTLTLASDQVEVQVDAFHERVDEKSPAFIAGTVGRSGLLGTEHGAKGRRVVALAADNDASSQAARIVHDIDSSVNTSRLLANLPYLCTALHLISKAGNIRASDRILLLPGTGRGEGAVGRALASLARLRNWPFKIACASDGEVPSGADEDSHVVLQTTSDVSRVMREYAPTVIIGHDYSSITSEVWCNIPDHGRLVLNHSSGIGELDMSPLARDASMRMCDTARLFSSESEEAKGVLHAAIQIFLSHEQSFTERATECAAHEISSTPSNSGDGTTAVYYYDHDRTDLRIISDRPRVQFDPEASYLLVGCLGGLGRSLTTFMRDRGALRFIFVSRSGSDKPEAARIVDDLRSSGADVQVHRCDAGDAQAMADVVNNIDPSKPLKGVVHAAMVLKDRRYEKMSHDEFMAAIRPKVDAARAIEAAITDIDLDFFVMTSSISSVIGNAGQANYSAANSFLDQVAWRRHLQDKAATSLALPMVLDVGVVAETQGLEGKLAGKGMYGIDEQEMITAFGVAMLPPNMHGAKRFGSSHMILGVEASETADIMRRHEGVEVQWYRDQRFCHIRADVEKELSAAGGSTGAASGGFAAALKTALAEGPDAALELIGSRIMKRVASTLMIPESGMDLDSPASVASYGLDSMIGAEFRTWIFREFGLDIPFQTLLSSSLTFKELSGMVLEKCM